MKRCLLLILPCAVATAALAQQNGRFGLHRGMTGDQVIQIIGEDAIKKYDGDTLTLKTVPKPHAAFEYYSLIISPDQGLLKIIAAGNDIRTNGFGEKVRDTFNELLDAIAQTYGKPDNNYNLLMSGSIWNDPQDWMTGLLKEERTLAAFWLKGPFPNGIQSLSLQAKASSRDTGYIVLSYEFEGWNAYRNSSEG